MPPELEEVIQVANEAAAFVLQPFYQRWLKYAERLADNRLRELKTAQSSDPKLLAELRRNWIVAEDVVERIQMYPQQCINAGREAQEILSSQNSSGLEESTYVG